MNVEEELETLFLVHDYQWSIDGVKRNPTSDDIREAIDKAVERLYDEIDGTQIEIGRLIIKKSDGHYDIYTMIGETS